MVFFVFVLFCLLSFSRHQFFISWGQNFGCENLSGRNFFHFTSFIHFLSLLTGSYIQRRYRCILVEQFKTSVYSNFYSTSNCEVHGFSKKFARCWLWLKRELVTWSAHGFLKIFLFSFLSSFSIRSPLLFVVALGRCEGRGIACPLFCYLYARTKYAFVRCYVCSFRTQGVYLSMLAFFLQR